jgi:hypothetical protein
LIQEGDYIFSIPDVSNYGGELQPIRTAEVLSVTATRAKLDNGVTVMRDPNGGGPYGNWLASYGFSNENYDFQKERMVWVRRENFGHCLALYNKRRETELRIKTIFYNLTQKLGKQKTVGGLSKLEDELLVQIESLLPNFQD